VTGADINVQKQISGSYVTIASGVSDDSGTASFYLLENNPYRLVITYNSNLYYYSFNALAQTYMVTLNETLSMNFTSLFDDIYLAIGPSQIAYNGSEATHNETFTMLIVSNTSSLTMYGLQVVCNGTTTLNATNVTGSASGGTIEIDRDIAGCDNVTMSYYFLKSGYDLWWGDRFYQISRGTGYGLYQALRLVQGGFDPPMQIFIFVVCLIVIASALAAFGPEGSIAATLISFGIFVYMDLEYAATSIGLSGIFVVIAAANIALIAVKRRWL
jgi:hypothetical protein